MPTEPWIVYPPEVNAARILGAGSIAWYTAAGIWAAQAANAAEAQAIFHTENVVQVSIISGATSESVRSTVAPYTQWLSAMQAGASRAAMDNLAVAEAHITALATIIPLPVVMAVRAAAAAGHTASAVGLVNPAGVTAEAQLAEFQIQNGTSMATYDSLVTTATAPRTFPAPPPLTSGGLGKGVSLGESAARSSGKSMQSAAQRAQTVARNPQIMQQVQQQATSQLMHSPLNSSQMQPVRDAFAPANSLMSQLSTPIGGVTGSGLGSGSTAMSGGGLGGSFGGLPLTSPNTLSAPVSTGTPSTARPPFSGIPTSEGTASNAQGGRGGPLAGAPGAGAGGSATKKSKIELTAETIEVNDPVLEQERKAREARLFV